MEEQETAPVPLVIFGVPFHNVTFEEAVEWIVARVRSGRPASVATANVDFLMQAWKDPELQRILIDADMVLADGFPIVKVSPFFGPRLKQRVTGSDLTPMLAERAAVEGISVYGLGGAEGVMRRAMEILKIRYPDLKVAGTYAPSYRPLLDMDHRSILQRLEEAKPGILFVALGVPKQEKFINMHVRGWSVPVALGIGASLDYIVGAQRRAPVWMQRINMEWFWRLCSEPRRLVGRYVANFGFLVVATRKLLHIHHISDHPGELQPLEWRDVDRLSGMGVVAERFSGLKDEEAARCLIERLGRNMEDRNVLLDLHGVAWLDSLELGALLEVNKLRRAAGRRLILYALRPKVRRLLETCRLTDYFNAVTRLEAVEELVKKLNEPLFKGSVCEKGALRLELPLELTAATLPAFEKQAEFIHHELQKQGSLKALEVDASRLDFIDSSGIGFLISLKKTMQIEGISMSIANVASKPRRTFEIARVDKVLLQA